MTTLESALIELQEINNKLMSKLANGERLNQDDQALLKQKVKDIHLATEGLETEFIAELLERYDLGLGLGHVEPGYERINEAFAWLEERDGIDDED